MERQSNEYGSFGPRDGGGPGWGPGVGGYPPPTPPTAPSSIVVGPGPAPSNGLGIAGFVVAMVSLFTCGVLWPISLGLSIAGMRREPKGLAIAGLVLSILGMLLFVFWMLPFVLLPLIVVPMGLAMAPTLEVTSEQSLLAMGVQRHIQSTGSLPASLSAVSGGDGSLLTDPWGTGYRLVPGSDGVSFSIESAGPDKAFGTADDVRQRSSGGAVGPGWAPGRTVQPKPAAQPEPESGPE